MKFEYFLDELESIRKVDAIGERAHELIFPEISKFRKEALLKNPEPRLSAVAAIFFPKNGETNFLLIERQTYEGVHSGQIGFPGGKKELFDITLEATARRETEEEVGIGADEPTLIRTLSEVYIPPSGFLVQPYLFTLDYEPKLMLDPREVQSALIMPVERLMDDAVLENGSVPTGRGAAVRTSYFHHEGKKIWGATAMMLAELKLLLNQIKT
jgi:8-oxo-dGTP pyrophosphatase MutT (NUDIX family)